MICAECQKEIDPQEKNRAITPDFAVCWACEYAETESYRDFMMNMAREAPGSVLIDDMPAIEHLLGQAEWANNRAAELLKERFPYANP